MRSVRESTLRGIEFESDSAASERTYTYAPPYPGRLGSAVAVAVAVVAACDSNPDR